MSKLTVGSKYVSTANIGIENIMLITNTMTLLVVRSDNLAPTLVSVNLIINVY